MWVRFVRIFRWQKQRLCSTIRKLVEYFRGEEQWAWSAGTVAPSLLQEAVGRVAAEAMLNGVPPLVSDRGGLPEVCNGAGFVLPVPAEVTPATRMPVDVEVVAPWIDILLTAKKRVPVLEWK